MLIRGFNAPITRVHCGFGQLYYKSSVRVLTQILGGLIKGLDLDVAQVIRVQRVTVCRRVIKGFESDMT
jgi:hypothetical protein